MVKNILPYQILSSTIHEKYKKSYKNNSTWNEKFELPDGSYSVSDIQDYFEYIIRKHYTLTDNQPI